MVETAEELYEILLEWREKRERLLQLAYEHKLLELAKQIMIEDHDLLIALRDV